MIHRFARPVPEISMITNTVMDHIFLSHGHRISQWNFDILSPPMLQEYADVIHAKGAPLNNRPFALRGNVTSFRLYDFTFENQLVGHILN